MDITQQQQSLRIDPTLSLQLTQLLLENTSQVPQPNPKIKQAGTVCWKLPTKMSLFVNSREIWLCLDCLQFCEIPHTCQLVQVCLIRALRSLLHIISPPPQKEWVAHHPNWRPLGCSRWADRVASSKQPEHLDQNQETVILRWKGLPNHKQATEESSTMFCSTGKLCSTTGNVPRSLIKNAGQRRIRI